MNSKTAVIPKPILSRSAHLSMTWIGALWSSSAAWEGVEYIAEVMVIVCALLEVLADFEHILKGEENKTLRKNIEKRAAIGLVIGLAIGLMALVRTNGLFTDTIATLYGEERDANNRSTAAFDRATIAQDRADKAEIQAGIAIKQAAVLNKQAEDERLARVKIEERVAPRTFGEMGRLAIAKQLRPFARNLSGRTVKLSSYVGDSEGIALSLEIWDILSHAGIGADPTAIGRVALPSGLVYTGIELSWPVEDEAFMTSLSSGFSALKTKITINRGSTNLGILVGIKPIIGVSRNLTPGDP